MAAKLWFTHFGFIVKCFKILASRLDEQIISISVVPIVVVKKSSADTEIFLCNDSNFSMSLVLLFFIATLCISGLSFFSSFARRERETTKLAIVVCFFVSNSTFDFIRYA